MRHVVKRKILVSKTQSAVCLAFHHDDDEVTDDGGNLDYEFEPD